MSRSRTPLLLSLALLSAVCAVTVACRARSGSPITNRGRQQSAWGPKTLVFGGHSWVVRSDATPSGPGPNLWSGTDDNVRLDLQGRLHLRITQRNGQWYCPEVSTAAPIAYGEYSFYVDGRVDLLDPNVVLGLFVYENDTSEIDVEMSRWGDPTAQNAQFVIQPGWVPWNTHRFQVDLNGDYSTYRIGWFADRVDFEALHGHVPAPAPAAQVIDRWTHALGGRPVPDREHMHINLWLMGGRPPINGQEVEVVISDFTVR